MAWRDCSATQRGWRLRLRPIVLATGVWQDQRATGAQTETRHQSSRQGIAGIAGEAANVIVGRLFFILAFSRQGAKRLAGRPVAIAIHRLDAALCQVMP